MPTLDSLGHLIKVHWLAVLLALASALFVAAPVIATPFVLGSAYQGADIMHFGSDEHIYLSRAKESLEGKGTSQPYIGSNKNEQDPTFSYVESVLTLPLRVLGLSERIDIVTYYNILNFLGVFLLVLLIYIFSLRFTNDRMVALSAATFPITGYAIVEAHTLLYGGYDIYGRSLFPYISSLILFGFLIALHLALEKPFRTPALLVAGVLLGVSCWVYLYLWMYLFAFMSAFAVILLCLRRFDAFLRLLYVGIIGMVLGAYNIIHLFLFAQSAAYRETAYFYAAIQSHAFVWSNVGAVTLVLLALVLWKKQQNGSTAFLAALMAAGWIALNQQIITGKLLQYGHFFWYFVSPLSIIVSILLLSRIIPKKMMTALAALIVVVGFLNIAAQQSRAFAADLPQRIADQKFMPIVQALRQNSPGSVLTGATGDSGPFFIPMYTDDDLYWIPAAENHSFSPDMLEEALLVHLYLNRDSRANPIAYLQHTLPKHGSDEITYLYTEWEGSQSPYDYYSYGRHFSADDPALTPLRKKLFDQIQKDYSEVASPEALQALMQKRDVRYVVWDREQSPQWDLSALGKLTVLATSSDLTLYRIDRVSPNCAKATEAGRLQKWVTSI
jgi:hypothetical protein